MRKTIRRVNFKPTKLQEVEERATVKNIFCIAFLRDMFPAICPNTNKAIYINRPFKKSFRDNTLSTYFSPLAPNSLAMYFHFWGLPPIKFQRLWLCSENSPVYVFYVFLQSAETRSSRSLAMNPCACSRTIAKDRASSKNYRVLLQLLRFLQNDHVPHDYHVPL